MIKISKRKLLFLIVFIFFEIASIVSNCGIHFAGETKSEFLTSKEQYKHKRNYSNKRRNLQTSCSTRTKILFDFNVLLNHINFVDFQSQRPNSSDFKPHTDIIRRLI